VSAAARNHRRPAQILSALPRFISRAICSRPTQPRPDIAIIEGVLRVRARGLDLIDTAYSIEMRIDAGRVSVIEVNGRLGWDEGFGDFVRSVTGEQPRSCVCNSRSHGSRASRAGVTCTRRLLISCATRTPS